MTSYISPRPAFRPVLRSLGEALAYGIRTAPVAVKASLARTVVTPTRASADSLPASGKVPTRSRFRPFRRMSPLSVPAGEVRAR